MIALEQHIQGPQKALFWLFGLATMLCSIAAFDMQELWPLLLPAIPIGAFLVLKNIRWAFYFMLVTLPLSMEISIGGSTLEVPAEPITIGFMLVSWLFILSRIRQLDFSMLKHPIMLLLGLHFLWMWIASIQSENLLVSVKFMLVKTWYLCTFVLLASLILRRLEDIKTAFWCLFIPLFIQVIIVFIRQAAMNFSFEHVNFAIMPLYRNHVNYAVVVAMVFPFLFMASKWYKKRSFQWWMLTLAKPLFIAAVYFSYTRSSMLGLLIGIAAYFVIRAKLLKPALIAALIGLGGITHFLLNDNQYLEFAPEYTKTIHHKNFEDHMSATANLNDASGMERFYRWIGAGYMSEARPWFGWGPGNFYPYYKRYTIRLFETYLSENKERSTVHNYLILVLAEQGIIGLVIFMLFTSAIFWKGQEIYNKASRANRDVVMACLVSLIIIYVGLMFSDLLEAIKIGGFFLLCLTIMVNVYYILPDKGFEKDQQKLH